MFCENKRGPAPTIHTMVKSTRSLVALLLALSQLALLTSAWTLSDRVSGRAFPPRDRKYLTRRSAVSEASSSSTKNDKEDMVSFMEEPIENAVGDLELQSSDSADAKELAEFVRCIVKAADGRKAEDIVALRVNHVSTLTSYLVILSGNSRPQNQAIAAAIRDEVKQEYDMRPGGDGVPEGNAESGWMLLDYGSVMCHIMTPKSRLFYNIEGQWRDKGGEEMDLADVLIPNKPESVMGDLTGESGFVSEEDDPFWS